MKKERCYLICTADEYETALYCADTVEEVARILEVKTSTIHTFFYRAKSDIIKVGGLQVERVWLTEDLNTPINYRSNRY